jgi:hypothetical protein
MPNTGNSAKQYERSEPMTDQSQHEHDERWLALLHNECNCNVSTKCAAQLRALLANIRAVSSGMHKAGTCVNYYVK